METLRQQLNKGCDYRMADETMDKFLSLMTEVRLKNKEPMVPYGTVGDSIYVIKEGIVRFGYLDGSVDRTYAFAIPGDMIISYHSYYKGFPSFYQYESCGKSVIMKVSKAKFDEFLRQSSDFSTWMLRMSMDQLWHWEMKTAVINGTAKERFEALIKNRPEILRNVSNRIIASYIGVDESYLSRLKRTVLPKV